MMAFCPEHPKWDQNPKFTPLSETTSIPTHFIGGVPPSPGPIVSTRFLFFVFYRDTHREPLRRREAAGLETGRRISFGSLQLENTAEIQATRAIAQALSEHVETFLSSTVEKCFALAKKLDQILQHCKSIWTRNLFIKKNFTKVALIRIFANINEFIIVKEQLIWLYQIPLANISWHCCASYIGLVTFFTYLEATHLSVFHRCSTRSSCNIQ